MTGAAAWDVPPNSDGARMAGAAIGAFLRQGGEVGVLIGAQGPARLDALDAALAGMPGHVIRTGNRLPGRLTLSRLLFQIGAADDGGDRAAALVRALSFHGMGDAPAVLVVDDAETLAADVLPALARVPDLAGPARPGIRILLSGQAPLLDLLTAPELEPLRAAGTTMQARLPDGPAVAVSAAAEPEGEAPPPEAVEDPVVAAEAPAPPVEAGPDAEAEAVDAFDRVRARVRRSWIGHRVRTALRRGMAVSAGAVAVAAACVLTWRSGVLPAWPEFPEVAAVAATQPPAVAVMRHAAAKATPIPSIAVAPPPARRVIVAPQPVIRPVLRPIADRGPPPRAAFDGFLDRTGAPALAPQAREALYREYVDWQATRMR